jgi:biopolymer transport protein ExbD
MKLATARPSARIPTLPLLDLALLVLVFFGVSSMFSGTRGLDLTLPDAAAATVSDATFVNVAADGSVAVDCRPTDASAIVERLRPGRRVIVYANPYARYQSLIAVLDALSSAEAERGFVVPAVWVPTRTDVAGAIERVGYNPFERRCASD